ncbi:ABC transporter ATP-binding protein [Bifidobacterium sp. 82T10]|uniref:ABC transporter ATP-binding protein n=1 Tax=Bifidobacterium miconis TaxID=2834435 RepID=A0ABS6WFK4_9BIFI|nr:ABC transporter ATP-binding protein [Bifidobacterium miconis]MBW3092062.1 ABC transporter ATP-binding protein [Bifidobacterium miconis]
MVMNNKAMNTGSNAGPALADGSSSVEAGAYGLDIENLDMTLNGKHLLNKVCLHVEPGKVTGLAGESGSGKSLTSLSVLKLFPDDAKVTGRIMYKGRNLLDLSEHSINGIRGREIALVFQDPTASLHPMISIQGQMTDHMRHHLGLSKKDAIAKAEHLLAMVHIPDPVGALKKYPHQFSGGQLQRIAIAMAMACDPTILIADEPTTALDVTVQAEILHLLRELCDKFGLTLILVTHDLGVMSALADNIAVMKAGEIVEYGTRHDIITDPKNPYTKSLIDALPMNMMKRGA